MTAKSLKTYKKNGKPQRSDVTLTKEVACALVEMILSGQGVFKEYPKEKWLTITLHDTNGGERQAKLSLNTVNDWVRRNIVVPETGVALRDLLEKARLEYRTRKEAAEDEWRKGVIDHKFNRVISLRTKEPVIGMFGTIKHPVTGKVVMKENPQILKIQMDNVQWLAERLNPERYGKVERAVTKHLVFSLSDLRRAEEAETQKQEYAETK